MIRDTPVCKAGFEGGDYNSAKAGGSCKIVKPGRSFCCVAFILAARIQGSTDTGREVEVLFCQTQEGKKYFSQSSTAMSCNALLQSS